LPLPKNLPYNKARLIGFLGPPPSQTGGPNVSRSRPRSDQLESLFLGYGYKPHFVEGDDPVTMHQLMAATLDIALDEIASIQRAARSGHDIVCPQWPMIILRSPKGLGKIQHERVDVACSDECRQSEDTGHARLHTSSIVRDHPGPANFCLCRSGGDQPVAYLNSGSILSPSLVPPGSVTLSAVNFSVS
jgi:hypothetical protein